MAATILLTLPFVTVPAFAALTYYLTRPDAQLCQAIQNQTDLHS